MSALVKQLRLLQAWYLPAGPEPEEAMPSKYRAFKEAADRIMELEHDLAARDAELAVMKAQLPPEDSELPSWKESAIAWKQRAEAAERERDHNWQLTQLAAESVREWKRKAEEAARYKAALNHQRTALSIIRDRQCHEGVCTVSLVDISKGIALLDAAIAAKGEA